jgi:hypothetical protein
MRIDTDWMKAIKYIIVHENTQYISQKMIILNI